MPHIFELASSGRAKCRGCGQPIGRGEMRFGERLPNPFADAAEMTIWFHPVCAAYKRPEPLLQGLADTSQTVRDRAQLEQVAHEGLTLQRLVRIDGAEPAPSGQAKCRSCRDPIARGAWRIRLAFFEEGRFSPGGYVHLECREAYFETDEICERLLRLSPGLSDDERAALRQALNRKIASGTIDQAPRS